MKVKNFDKQKKESEKVNVESPRFISTLKRALEDMFKQFDSNNSGTLTYEEFKDCFGSLSYGLNENDINMMIAMADEDQDERIHWKEFLPIGIDIVKNIYSRNIAKANADLGLQIDSEALRHVFADEINRTSNLLNYSFRQYDKNKVG